MRRRSGLTTLSLLMALGAGAGTGCRETSEVVHLGERPAHQALADSGTTELHPIPTPRSAVEEEISPRLLRRFAPIGQGDSTDSRELVDLGRMLYFEPLLSRTGKISCNTCHPLADGYGTTNTVVSTGIDGLKGTRNAPSTYNAVGHFRQFWDGRAVTLQEQAKGPIQDHVEMDMKPQQAVRALAAIPAYREQFARAFPRESDPVKFENVGNALAAFERGLITPGRWDRYLRGDLTALSAREKEGAKVFSNAGCVVCHEGAYLGGTMFEKLGIHKAWPNQSDHGRRNVSSSDADDMVFKVPSLRNVARTAPYFHDGSVAKLTDAILLMGRYQLGEELAGDEVEAIAAWMQSLTGEIPREYIAAPALPLASRP